MLHTECYTLSVLHCLSAQVNERNRNKGIIVLTEAGVVGDGGLIEPQFFILFSELGVDPILLSFKD